MSEDATLLPEPPAMPEAEKGLLGCIMVKGAWAEMVADQIEPQHFSEEAYGRFWSVVLKLVAADTPVTMPALVEPLTDALEWERSDVVKLLLALPKGVAAPSADQVRHYATLIKDVWIRRQLFLAADEIKGRARVGAFTNTAEQILEDVEAKLYAISSQNGTDERSHTFAEAIEQGLDEAEAASQMYDSGKLPGVTAGIDKIDRKMGGFRGTDLIVLGAATGAGKTSMALKIASAAAAQFMAENGEKPAWVYIASLEMPASQLGLRQVCAEARVSFERVRLGQTSVTEMAALAKAGSALRALPIRIDDDSRMTVGKMRSRVRRLKRKHGVGLIIIDYLQKVALSREDRRECGENRAQQISLIVAGLKNLAKDFDVPVIALAQLSRDIEKREDKRPQMSDLRESASIEMDADVVALLFREAYYLQKKPPSRREKETEFDYNSRRGQWAASLEKCREVAEFIVAKNRHGSAGTIMLKFLPELMLFMDDGASDEDNEVKSQMALELMGT